MSKIDRKKVYQKFGGHCSYCGKRIEFKDMQADHFWPQSRAHFYNSEPYRKLYDLKGDNINSLENLMPSCRRCNHYKRTYTIEQYRDMIKTINDRVFKNYIAKVALDYGTVKKVKWDGLFYFERYTKSESTKSNL